MTSKESRLSVNHSKILTYQKLHSPLGFFGLKSVHEFVIPVGRIKPIVCLVFYLVIKTRENLYKRPYQKWKTAKIFKKHQNAPMRTHKKRQKLFYSFLGEYTLFLSPLPLCLKRENENRENWDGRGSRGANFLKNHQSDRGKGERK